MARRLRHGHARGNVRTPIYSIWATMKSRCGRATAGSYQFYGARGIRVCRRWLKFENFLADMGPRPAGCQLDRIDTNGDYEPGNCRWVTARTNARNRRNTRHLTIDGITKSLKEWAEIYGLNFQTLVRRVQLGWDAVRAVTTPLQHPYYGAR